MKVVSATQLAIRLDRNLMWRKKELTQLKFIADTSLASDADALRRSGLTLMYAHWEGFIKDASELYLAYLANNEVELNNLRSCFVAVAMKGEIRSAGYAAKVSAHKRLVDAFRSLDGPPPVTKRLPVKRVIATRSNLKGAVLREITATLGIDYSQFELKENGVIDRLVAMRNLIAHGRGRPVSKADYDQLHKEIILLMDAFKDLIQDAAANDSHLITP